MSRIQRPARGYSMVELVVTAGVISLLLAAALPAMQQSRENARRTACQFNLKQIGLSMHNYHDTYNTLPPAWTSRHPHAGPQVRFGWMTFILPFLDQTPLCVKLDLDRQNPPPNELTQTHIPPYRCPADRTPAINPLRGNYGTANYSMNFGPVAPPRWVSGRLSAAWPGQADTFQSTDGISWLNSRMRLHDISDGLSNTIAVGERSSQSGAGIWIGVGGNEFEDDQVTDCSPGNEINSGFAAFSSLHGGGANFLLADGAVRFVTETIESHAAKDGKMGVYQLLSNRHDGNAIDGF